MKLLASIGGAMAALLCTLAVSHDALAADPTWPTRPIKIIVGYAPGGTTDIVARVIAPKMGEDLGQTVIVENKAGAAGNLGAELVARSPADGYTLQMGTAGNMTINPWIYPNIGFDPIKDFAAVSLVAQVPNLMVVNPSVPANNVQEFIAWARQNAGKVNFASSGTGNSPHMTGELFKQATGLSMVHVPYRGSGPALSDLMAGQGVQVMFDNMPSAIGFARSGRLRALAVTSAQRSAAAPDVPTMKEAGVPGVEVEAWFGLFAPAGTPPAIVERLHQAVLAALKDGEVRKKLQDMGAQVVGNTPAEFGNIVKTETARWGDVVRRANVKMN